MNPKRLPFQNDGCFSIGPQQFPHFAFVRAKQIPAVHRTTRSRQFELRTFPQVQPEDPFDVLATSLWKFSIDSSTNEPFEGAEYIEQKDVGDEINWGTELMR